MIEKDQIFIESVIKEMAGEEVKEIIPLPASGSSRRYFRLVLEIKKLILCFSDNIEENKTFISLARYFRCRGISVPEIYSVSSDYRLYSQQDLGDVQYLSILNSGNRSEGWSYMEDILGQLSKMQFQPENEWSELVGFEEFGESLINYDFNYFKTQFLRKFEVGCDSEELDKELCMIKDRLLLFPKQLWGFMFRDFQSRNVMISGNRPWFIDFQSGRKGPCLYDFVSFAWQAKAAFAPQERKKMLEIYSEQLKRRCDNVKAILEEYLPYFAAFRLLQVLGAYGLRGLTEGKPHFISSIPPALQEFCRLIDTTELGAVTPELKRVIAELGKKFN